MSGRQGKKKIAALYAAIPPNRRANFFAKLYSISEAQADEIVSDQDMSTRDKVRSIRDLVGTVRDLEDVELKIYEQRARARDLFIGLRERSGGASSARPSGLPPHVAAVWDRFCAGDPSAEKIVREWREATADASEPDRRNPSGEPDTE